jgi:enoyl-CoA hydratase/carnithine racemase
MIPFTQYLMPDGERRKQFFDRPPEVETKAKRLIASGAVFESEVLTTGLVSLTCELLDEEETLAHEICAKGPDVLDAIDRLVNRAYERMQEIATTGVAHADDDAG